MSDPKHDSAFDDAPTVKLPAREEVLGIMRDVMTAHDGDKPPQAFTDDLTIKMDVRAVTGSTSRYAMETAGMQIGNYLLKQELGRGGFGTVWWAEQVAPFKRDVALKIILQGMDSEEVLARFEAEKKLLAKMDHPNIAAVYDAGTTESGRPFFVMEMVKGSEGPGKPITKYCDEKHLSVRERIQLFIPVCQAVQHAHMKQVLHRDLKPTNILVAEVDGFPVPKIIDFGIAKAMSPDEEELLASRLRTAADMVIGTLQYMSPEQAGSFADIDTRSDVYTLGVILYELLVGEPPIGREEVKKAVFDVLQMIRDATPPRRPSTRWLSATEAQKQQAVSTRRTDPRRLSQQIHGDLDWIVLKALEKDRTRRYSAAMELAEDLSRFLKNEPVSAGPPSAGYRIKKIIQRNKLAFAASAAVLVSIIAGGSAAAWQWRIAVAARDAEADARQSAENARIMAENARLLAESREKEAQTARELEAKARILEAQARQTAEDQRNLADAARSQAEKERGIAITARGEAEDLINYMLFDLRDKLEPLNRIALLDDVAKKSEAYFKSQPADSETDTQKRNRGGMWQNRGQIALAMGHTDEAVAAFREFHRIMAERAQAAPHDKQRILDLAVADGRMSLVHEQSGLLDAAFASAKAEQTAVQALHEANLSSAGLARHLATTHERLGDLSRKRSRLDEAAASYQKGTLLLDDLIKRDPKDVSSHKARTTLTERRADLSLEAGRLTEASQALDDEISELQSLLDEALGDASLRRALAVALQKQSIVQMKTGKTSEAANTGRQALDLMQHLYSADPGNLQLLHDLSVAHENLAQILSTAGSQDAKVHWQRDLDLSGTLAAADPSNIRWQVDLAVSHWNVARVELNHGTPQSIASAVTHLKAGLGILEKQNTANKLDDVGKAWLASFSQALKETSRIPK
ncbi:MAG: protein kinase [Prosthecobacter sp.]|jgi:serine/threonine protein kinase/tetratricopeptide (TPR) repeat protein|uniref:serine/threonine protein kinase n=1 Tax=Prosthecobacter sp. TaxID=1965333 RepID=UPI001A0BF6D7|nr:serine/threonine protein kinase [Prosthecobacter sp.]MBE2284087.1 protein kinase [Prosthecobacter sp.]